MLIVVDVWIVLDDVREDVRRLLTRCVTSTKKITIVLGLKSRVVTISVFLVCWIMLGQTNIFANLFT
jgi:hypothetical protein